MHTIRAFIIDGDAGPLIAVYYRPSSAVPFVTNVIVAPPFGEEMNRCRAMVSMQARAMSASGIGTLVLDPYGTGDSAGEFVEATWDQWRSDLKRGIDWLRRDAGGCGAAWGVRLGAIMAAQLATEDSEIDRLMLWQPVTQGKAFWTQFLRIRIAAEMGTKGGVKTTEELRQRSAAGEAVEVSGYMVGSALAMQLDTLALPGVDALAGKRVSWFEVLADEQTPPPRASTKVLDELRAGAVEAELHAVIGPPFWHVHERAVAPALIAATSESVARWSDPARPAQNRVDAASTHDTADRSEYPLVLPCGEDELMAVVHKSKVQSKRGVVIVVAGGPQFRSGAHRQFVSLARRLSDDGYPVMRFDLRGMGDSSGAYLGYQHSRADLRSAIDRFMAAEPSVREVVLFGECESASGILFYAFQDGRVAGTVLVNPWVRTEEGQAMAFLKHYYRDRIFSRQFWLDVVHGRFRPIRALKTLVETVRSTVRGWWTIGAAGPAAGDANFDALPLPVKTAEGLRRYKGPVFVVMSGQDYIAREFDEVTKSSPAWTGLLQQPRLRRLDVEGADHTFSKEHWKKGVHDAVVSWLGSW